MKRKTAAATKGAAAGKSVRLRPANPFDLIRLIAHSQGDPRKAMAELVQNSLDAGATRITITRWRKSGVAFVSIHDDGRGVFPDLPRPEALERIATNVGHSFKRNLSASERQQEMMLGKYGIGILGFWSVGEELEMRSRVVGSDTWALHLVRDEPMAEVVRMRDRRIEFPSETWTEIVIRGVHASAARQIAGRKLGDYLGSELRGQLLERKVTLRIVDKVARGRSLKDFLVVPERFRGRKVQDLFQLSVVGYAPARLEIYVVDPGEVRERPPTVAVTCGGTVVCEDIAALDAADFERPPWTSRVFEGFVEFSELEVAPATRRGLVPGPAAEAFFEALRGLEPELLRLAEMEKERQSAEEDGSLAHEIRKVFRPVARTLPQYDFFEIVRRTKSDSGAAGDAGARLGHAGEAGANGASAPPTETTEVVEDGDLPEPEPEILPPGPLTSVRIVPRRSRLLPGSTRKLKAKAVDSTGRVIPEGVDFQWTLRDGAGKLTAQEDLATYEASESTGKARVFVHATQWKREVEADAEIEVVEKLAGESPDAGIPDPERVYDPAGDWRSRVVGKRWQYNAAHPDYKAVVEDARRRLRYMVHLFAKEMVLMNYGEPKDERLLERIVEVLTHVQPR
ncbi:MAG TPA: ATP-binding protein [Planctomycetota bacterium]|nr:ATP-binding protein [Planctomycetota bacterium]